MPIELNCKCGHRFSVSEGTRGTLVECPACTGRIFVPSVGPGAPMDLAAPQAGAAEVSGMLTSDEMLTLREEEQPAQVSGAEALPGVDHPAAPAPEAGPHEERASIAAGETEVAPAPEAVLAGPEDSGLVSEGAAGFAVRYEEEVQAERRRFDRCPQCDVALDAETRVCTNCGYDLTTGERVKRVTVEAPEETAAEVTAEVGRGLLDFLATWTVKLRYAVVAASILAFLIIELSNLWARNSARNAYLTEMSGGGLVGRWWEAATKAVEQEAYDLERGVQQQVEMALVKMQNEPRAEEGVYSPESRTAAQEAFLAAREAYVIHGDPVRAERILTAIEVLYGALDPWGARAREELARLRASASQPAASPTRSRSAPSSATLPATAGFADSFAVPATQP